MRLASPWFLVGTALALVIGLILILGSLRAAKDRARFGDAARIAALTTADAAKRRAWKGVLLVLATALAFFAAARPQYGKGTRYVPAANVDIVIALDYSKSMYARDVEPSRIFRAKGEISRLVRSLPQARFAAVAFAGEPMGFPLTPDGRAVTQFLRRLEPNDMPVGGTAIGRALNMSRDLLENDPKSKDHKRIIILITDGEDLEGDPVAIARRIGRDKTTVHVVQIGGRTPEPIPEVGPDGEIRGFRRNSDGSPMTTELSAEAEEELADIAKATPGGQLIRAEKGSTGIDQITEQIKQKMTTEWGEEVEEDFADVFHYPLGLAVLLLLLEGFITEARKRVFIRRTPPPEALHGKAKLRKAS